jgi:hypothetical protein
MFLISELLEKFVWGIMSSYQKGEYSMTLNIVPLRVRLQANWGCNAYCPGTEATPEVAFTICSLMKKKAPNKSAPLKF